MDTAMSSSIKPSTRDNWQTFVPNLEPCFVNMSYLEKETEFDFNVKSFDNTVINRYCKLKEKQWDFGQGEPCKNAESMELVEDAVPGEPVYPFLDLSRIIKDRYKIAEVKASDRHFTDSGEVVWFKME